MELLVSGAGPAGVATAIGLVRCGLDVVLLTGARPRPWLEGVSLRTRDALERIGCRNAAALAGDPHAQVERHVRWGASRGVINRETLVDRVAFDAALQRDAVAAGVCVVEDALLRADRVARDTSHIPDGADTPASPDARWSFRTRAGRRLRASYWVDARGRSAPRGRRRQRGVATLAVAIPCALSNCPGPASALVAGEHGFFWIVTRGDGHAWTHWFRDPPERGGPAELAAEGHAELERLREEAEPRWLGGLRKAPDPAPGPRARDATPYQVEEAIGGARVRVGDAAAATDPLSGQGVWRALSMARAATACARTELERPEAGALARRFYRERVAAIYWRDATTGRHFYREEQRWPRAPFWARRRNATLLSPERPATAHVVTRPVVRDGYVEAGRVVCTPDDPEGVWRVAGVPVVDLLEAVGTPRAELAERFSASPAQLERAQSWLRAWGLTGPSARNGAERLTAQPAIPQSGVHG